MPETPQTKHRIQQVTPTEFCLLCDICGKRAMFFKQGALFGEEGLLIHGLVSEYVISLEHAPVVFELLQRGVITGLHAYIMKHGRNEGGLEAYCPNCDKIYCGEHMKTTPVFDGDGFYDDTESVCPEGHERWIAD